MAGSVGFRISFTSGEIVRNDGLKYYDTACVRVLPLVDDAIREHGPIHAVISTDGDSNRPLILGIDPDNKVRFFGGDLLGIVVADYLDADTISISISTNDAIDF